MKPVHPSVVNKLSSLSEEFQNNQPFKHVVIDDFLETEFCQKLLDEFPSFHSSKALNEDGELGGKAVNEKISRLGPSYQDLDKTIRSKEFLEMISELTGIPNLRYDPHYFGGGTHENRNGQSLDPHVDFSHHPKTQFFRRLNLIIYMNHKWEQSWGGCIDLHKNPRLPAQVDEVQSVLPLFNRAVIFETHHTSWHGFEEVQIPEKEEVESRKSFALYFYTKEKPEGYKRPHSTIYVDRKLSPEIQPGRTLSDQDYNQIQTLMSRRDQHIERLYNIISAQSMSLNKLRKAFGIVYTLSYPLRKIRHLLIGKKNQKE